MKSRFFLVFFLTFFSFGLFSQTDKVVLNLKWQKSPGFGSNQFALWIEDEGGNYVKTLFATKFTVKKGFKTRPDALFNWLKVFKMTEKNKKIIDSITNATPKSSKDLEITWNLDNENGEKVAPGKYIYKAESTLYFKEFSIFSGSITVGKEENSSDALVEYSPPETDKKDRGIISLSAKYLP